MSPMTWTLIAVVAFAVGWLLLPLAGAWASHSSRLDSSLERTGRPFRRAVDWLGEHWRVRLAIVVVLAVGYAVSAGLMFVGGYDLMGVLAILSGLGACTSVATLGVRWRQEQEAWWQSHQKPPRP